MKNSKIIRDNGKSRKNEKVKVYIILNSTSKQTIGIYFFQRTDWIGSFSIEIYFPNISGPLENFKCIESTTFNIQMLSLQIFFNEEEYEIHTYQIYTWDDFTFALGTTPKFLAWAQVHESKKFFFE